MRLKYRKLLLLVLATTLISSLFTVPATALVRAFDVYLDQPLVQGSYIADNADAITESFTNFPGEGVGSCTGATLLVGTVSGTCSVFNSPDYGAAATSSGQSIGGTGGKMVSGHPGTRFTINFSESKKYVGFWWAAGSNGNAVNFLSRGAVVASVDINQVFAKFGTAPYLATTTGQTCYGQSGQVSAAIGNKCFGNTMNINDASATLTSENNTKYLKNLYYGNPSGYAAPSGGPETIAPSSIVFNEPYVYIHAFAKNGADFDGVQFDGRGFEADNITLASNEKTPRGELVFVQSVPGNYLVNYDSQGGSSVTPGVFLSGGEVNSAPVSPTKSGSVFAGWTVSTESTTVVAFPYTPGVSADITLYGKWFSYSGISPNNGQPAGSWITLQGTNLSHSVVNGFGYQTVYYRTVANLAGGSPGSWVAISPSDVRDNSDTSIDVKVPNVSGFNFLQFHIDACSNWSAVTGCVSIDNFTLVYSILSRNSISYNGNSNTGGTVPLDVSSPYYSGDTVTVLTNSGNLVRSDHTFVGWNTQADGLGTNYLSDGTSTFSMPSSAVILYAKWLADSTPPPSSPPVFSIPRASPAAIEPLLPGVTWQPLDLIEGEKIGKNQLNANFSVEGTPTYSLSEGQLLEPGTFTLTVTFTPVDGHRYLALSTSRTFRVIPKTNSNSNDSTAPTTSEEPTSVKISQLKIVGVIYFNNNEYFLDLKDRQSIKTIAETIKKEQVGEAYVRGHTDVKKGVDNTWLSRARALAVSQYLRNISKESKLNSFWFAASRPAVAGITKADLALNRRVEIYIPKKVGVDQVGSYEVVPNIKKDLGAINFNRNDYFLDSNDRLKLKQFTAIAVADKCINLDLVGTRDQSIGANNESIASNRVIAVKNYLRLLYPAFAFKSAREITDRNRQVRISCST